MKNIFFYCWIIWPMFSLGCVENGNRMVDTEIESAIPGTEPDFSTDAVESDSDAFEDMTDSSDTSGCNVPSDAWACPAPAAATCEDAVAPLPVLLNASELGDNVNFTTLGNSSLLALEQTDTRQTVILYAGAYPFTVLKSGTARMAVPLDTNVSPVAVANLGRSEVLPAQIALICLDDACALYGADIVEESTVEMTALASGELPAMKSISGLWFSPEFPNTVCVYGTSIACFDGTSWATMYEGGDDLPEVLDMKRLGNGVVAVGQRGLIVKDGFPMWSASWGEAYPDLISVAVYNMDYLAVTANGRLYNMEQMWNPPCPIVAEAINHLTFVGGGSYPDFLGATASGKVFAGDGPFQDLSKFCFTGQTLENIIDITSNTCGISRNHLILTPDTLFGTDHCAVE